MKYAFETIAVGLFAFLALLGVAFAKDDMFQAHMWVLFFVLLVSTVLLLRRINFAQVAGESADDKSGYFDEVVRYGIIATTFWGIVGFLVGVVVAFQLAYPDLNIEPWFNFGRMRPLHTSAVIFAFGGNALIATSLYVVQRTSRARLFGGDLGWFVFWGYHLFIVMAADRAIFLGHHPSGREYSRTFKWLSILWLTLRSGLAYLGFGLPRHAVQAKVAAYLCGELVFYLDLHSSSMPMLCTIRKQSGADAWFVVPGRQGS